nr:hypothetical protein [Kibdelosporangium sp. MJ126-NF4]
MLCDTAVGNPPSRFAVCELPFDDDGPPGVVIAWGLATAERVIVHSVEPGLTGRFQSTDRLNYLFGSSHEIVWIDPEPEVLDEPA